ncbi:cation:proton antiporter [Gaoshiqia sediminis]|uniref:Cation:proton antiporter n=1 Tax=Gaoshiqia sediminis TaxID=2986998 RepID=A0AA41Y9D2_9BACT|nr:cation:proton antiporter [Gaoshiqia sediminis]MCW0483358.1 cation:proton antiporter [Gaoshiqia sediminis]
MVLLSVPEITLPLTNPVVKFFVILLIILVAPILLNRLKIPSILGLIFAGAVIGPHGVNLLLRDSGIILSGTAGLLYIMFLAGLEMDLAEFRRNRTKSLVFGLYTFLIPMVLGIVAGLYVLKFSVLTSVLLASMFASHTLIAYPALSKLGVAKIKAVNIAVGGTMITDTLALLVLAVIVGMVGGEIGPGFWARLSLSVLAFGLIVLLLFPIIGRWFLKKYEDNVSQYIFILVMVFLGAVLAEAAGVEAIIGAFLSGLALNRLIPSTSALMNRIVFVGNAVFIPFFLIGVGMLVDYRAFFQDAETIRVAAIMTGVATLAKFLAAWLTQKTFRFSADERRVIFGLSNAQAAATLAAVLIGYNVIVSQTASGEPIRLLGDSILNGTIVMIFITCTMATISAQKGGTNIALAESSLIERSESIHDERILIPVSNPHTIDELISLSAIIKSKNNSKNLFVLNVVNPDDGYETDSRARKLLEKSTITASSADISLNQLLRYNRSVANGIINAAKENHITDLVMGLHRQSVISESFPGKLAGIVLEKSNMTTFIYRAAQPIATIKRHLIVVPENAEHEIGFPLWLAKVWNIQQNTGARLKFYVSENTKRIVEEAQSGYPFEATCILFNDWADFLILARDVKPDDNLIVVLSRDNKPSHHPEMKNIPHYLDKYFHSNSYILIYPMQIGFSDRDAIDLTNPSLLGPIQKLDEMQKMMAGLFRKK